MSVAGCGGESDGLQGCQCDTDATEKALCDSRKGIGDACCCGAAGSEAVQHEAVGGCTSEHDCSGTSVVPAFAANGSACTT